MKLKQKFRIFNIDKFKPVASLTTNILIAIARYCECHLFAPAYWRAGIRAIKCELE